MNWGHKIAIVYLGFVVFMLTLVVLCVKQKDLSLVTDNYYADELAYQLKIDKMQNTSSLSTPPAIGLNSTNDSLVLDLTEQSVGASGILSFYRPSNARLDFSLPLLLDASGKQKCYLGKVVPGLWTLKLEWSKDGKEYYTERKLHI
jgi:hypothetical protein